MSNYDDDDDNEKQSKIQRDSRAFITRAIFFMVGLTLFALGLGHIHTKEPPQLSIDIKNMMEASLSGTKAHRAVKQNNMMLLGDSKQNINSIELVSKKIIEVLLDSNSDADYFFCKKK